MSIASVMTKRVVSVQMDDSLETVSQIFSASNFHHLLVVENNVLKGVISDRDFFKAVSPFLGTISERMSDRATLQRRAHQFMSRNVITLDHNDSMVRAIKLFNTHSVSCLPVIGKQGEPVGVISWRDILRYFGALVEQKR